MTGKKKSSSVFLFKFWNLFASFLGFVFLFFLLVNFGLFGDMPEIKDLENPHNSLVSEVYSEDGVMLGRYYRENRKTVNRNDIAQCVFQALIATEDVRFNEHSGIDPKGLARAFAKFGRDGGGSTITQQLAKNLFNRLNPPRNKVARMMQKFKEWIIAVRLEKRFTKDEIITLYLNTVPFSGHSYGIWAASKEFYNKSPKDLKPDQAAVLIGMLKANTAYNPHTNPEKSKFRRNVVLEQMNKAGFLSESDLGKYSRLPIKIDYQPFKDDGIANYFRDELAAYLKPWCKENGLDLYESGLKIYTTINYKAQKMAEEAMETHMKKLQRLFNQSWGNRNPWTYIEREKRGMEIPGFVEKQLTKLDEYKDLQEKYGKGSEKILQELKKPRPMTVFSWRGDIDTVMSVYDSMKYIKKFLHAAFIAIEPETGAVKAWVGGINHKFFKYDHVNKRARRQVGSTFKPLVYATAVDINGTTPCTVIPGGSYTFHCGDPWTPMNDGYFSGSMTVEDGLAQSNNIITAGVMKSIGRDCEAPKLVIKLAERMGIEKNRIPPYPSICLGSAELSPYEMASAYTAFVNKGLWVEPVFITRIEDKNGNVLMEAPEQKHDQVLSEEKAWVMWKMLTGVVEKGTSTSLKGIINYKGAYAGKTGTTQGNADGWFMGVTQNLVCATWVGGDEPSIRFQSTFYGQGATTALPIYGLFMNKAVRDVSLGLSVDPLPKPNNPGSLLTNCGEMDQGDNLVRPEGARDVDGLGGAGGGKGEEEEQ